MAELAGEAKLGEVGIEVDRRLAIDGAQPVREGGTAGVIVAKATRELGERAGRSY